MSRSYKHNAVAKDHNRAGSAKAWKRIANHSIRMKLKRLDYEIPFNQYKKAFETWSIHDYIIMRVNDEKELKRRFENMRKKYETILPEDIHRHPDDYNWEKYLKRYRKFYKRK